MDDWSKQLFDAFGSAVQDFTQQLSEDTERWLDTLTEQVAIASDNLVQTTDQWAEQVQEAIDPEIDRIVDELSHVAGPFRITINAEIDYVVDELNEMLGPLVTGLSGIDQWLEEVTGPINSTVEPLLQNHPTCVGCRNFCGQTFGGNTLVCAMHPYGPEEDHHCEDWESFWPDPSEQ